MVDDNMIKELYNVIGVELFFVDINSRCSDFSHNLSVGGL